MLRCLFAAILVLVPASAEADAPPLCIPLPIDYRVALDVRDGSAFSLAESMACLGGLSLERAPGLSDRAVTVTSTEPSRYPLALTDVNRALARVGLVLRTTKGRLLLATTPCVNCPSAPPKQPLVRGVLDGARRVATLTTEVLDCPPRSLLDRTDLVTPQGPFRFTISRDVRKLAARDPMAFVSEGAAFPNPLSFPAPGFVIAFIRPGGVLDRAGLRVGDVLTVINGMPLRGLSDAFFAYGMLVDADLLVAQVVRGTETLVFTYEFR